MRRHSKLRLDTLALVAVNVVILGFIMLPLVGLLLGSVQTERSLLSMASGLVPSEITLSNYMVLLGLAEGGFGGAGRAGSEFPRALISSFLVGAVTTLATVALASLTAYSTARLKWRGGRAYTYLILVTRMVPEVALIIPLYLTLRGLGFLNSYLGLVVAEMAVFVPIATWILVSYLESLPWDLEDAARIDGCSRLGAYLRVILPISAPGVAACSVVVFMLSWHMLIIPMIINSGPEVATLPVFLSRFITDFTIRYSEVNAAAVMALVPTVILILLLQKYVVAGLTAGSMK